jgi:hypothetical protein
MTPETIASFQEIMCHCAVAQSAGFRAGQIWLWILDLLLLKQCYLLFPAFWICPCECTVCLWLAKTQFV